MDAGRFFAQSYAEARAKFLAAVDAAGGDVHSHAHPLLGRDGEALAMDVARFGAHDAPALLIVSIRCSMPGRTSSQPSLTVGAGVTVGVGVGIAARVSEQPASASVARTAQQASAISEIVRWKWRIG